MLRFIYYNN